MKRLWVRPAYRGHGLGLALCRRLIDEARAIGYETMRLDTIGASMARAVALYRSLGFKQIEPYYDNPIAGALYLELRLDVN
jgi:carbonic anhydrase